MFNAAIGRNNAAQKYKLFDNFNALSMFRPSMQKKDLGFDGVYLLSDSICLLFQIQNHLVKVHDSVSIPNTIYVHGVEGSLEICYSSISGLSKFLGLYKVESLFIAARYNWNWQIKAFETLY